MRVGAPPICRFHNYDSRRGGGCKKLRSGACPLDHEHCHFCLEPGHVAKECARFLGGGLAVHMAPTMVASALTASKACE